MSVFYNAMLLLLLSGLSSIALAQPGSHNVWQAVDRLRSQTTMTPASVGHDLNTALTPNTRNDYFLFYQGSGPATADTVRIGNIDLRVRAAPPHDSFMVLNIEGTGCITLNEVKKHFSALTLNQVPHGHSWEEETGYRTTADHRSLAFGFAEKRPECLASIVFETVDRQE